MATETTDTTTTATTATTPAPFLSSWPEIAAALASRYQVHAPNASSLRLVWRTGQASRVVQVVVVEHCVVMAAPSLVLAAELAASDQLDPRAALADATKLPVGALVGSGAGLAVRHILRGAPWSRFSIEESIELVARGALGLARRARGAHAALDKVFTHYAC